MVGAISQVLGQLVRPEGRLTRNVAALVDRVPGGARAFETFTVEQVQAVLRGIAADRNRHAWHLALAGLRRGEIAGLRWAEVDLDQRTVRIGKTRVDVGGRCTGPGRAENCLGRPLLPLPDVLLAELLPLGPVRPLIGWRWARPSQTWVMSSAMRPASRTTRQRCRRCGRPPLAKSMCRKSVCTMPAILVLRRCTCRACPSRWSPHGSATLISRSRCGPTCTHRRTHWS